MDRRGFLALTGAVGAGAASGWLARSDVASRALRASRVEQRDAPYSGSHRVIWSVETDRPVAALTFDDGPDPEFTPHVLDILDRAGVRATFFMMGWNADAHRSLARDVVAAGHEVGNHTWSHQNLGFSSPGVVRDEVRRGGQVVAEVTGVELRWFRPPRGQISGFSIREAAMLGQDTVLWSVTRGTRGEGTAEAVRSHVAARLGAGDIVDLHDGLGRGTFDPRRPFTERLRARRTVEVAALPGILVDAAGRGLDLVTMSELVAAETVADTRPADEAPPPDA